MSRKPLRRALCHSGVTTGVMGVTSFSIAKTVISPLGLEPLFIKTVKTDKFMKLVIKHGNVIKLVIERTRNVHADMSDLIVTCLGNERHFLTLCDTKCSMGHRTRSPIVNSLRKVFPNRVFKK